MTSAVTKLWHVMGQWKFACPSVKISCLFTVIKRVQPNNALKKPKTQLAVLGPAQPKQYLSIY